MSDKSMLATEFDAQGEPFEEEPQPLFCECMVCGERWKHCTLPIPVSKIPKSGRCPNCNETKRIGMCPTMGPNKVTEARNGKAKT